MNIQRTAGSRLTGHKKMIVTLGVGALALVAIACSSAVSTDDLTQGDPAPESPPSGQNSADFALGAPNGIGIPSGSDGVDSTEGKVDESGATSGGVASGVQGEIAAAPPSYDCDTGSTDPFTLYIENEPVTDPSDGVVIYNLPDIDGPAPMDGTVSVDPAVLPVQEVMDGSSLGMPVPGLFDVDEMIVDELAVPDAVSQPPSIEPSPEDARPEPIAIAEIECGSGSSSGSYGSSTDIAIEPLPVIDMIPVDSVQDLGDEPSSNVQIVAAPIESAGITVAESFPPQYMLWVVSGLSNGATTFGEYEVKRDGNIVAVAVRNRVQRDVMATQMYGIHESNIPLGSDFTSGETYEVVINGKSWTSFTAQ